MGDSKGHKWLDREILHPDDAHELEQAAARHEFEDGMPRSAAEDRAYRHYRREQHEKSAAFHYRGMKASQGSGDLDAARKHGAMFELHMKKLGHEPWQELPSEIQSRIKDVSEPSHKFKAHKGDRLVLDALVDDGVKKAEVQAQLQRIHGKATEVLAKAFPTNPDRPVGEGLTHEQESKYLNASRPSAGVGTHHESKLVARDVAEIAARGHRSSPIGQASREGQIVDAANKFRPGKPLHPAANATKDFRALKPEEHPNEGEIGSVAVDRLMEQGFQPEQPPKLEHVDNQGRSPEDIERYRRNSRLLTSNREAMRDHPDLRISGFDVGQPSMWTKNAWTTPSQRQQSEYLDDHFWAAVDRYARRDTGQPQYDVDPAPENKKSESAKPNRGAEIRAKMRADEAAENRAKAAHVKQHGIKPSGYESVTRPMKPSEASHPSVGRGGGADPSRFGLSGKLKMPAEDAQKAELKPAVPPGMAAPKPLAAAPAPAAKPMAPPAAPALHSNVESFMAGLKALPKGGPDRGKYITAHMNHGPFLSALQIHPQGKQVHQMLTTHLNSMANAGPRGPVQVTAKSELAKGVIAFPQDRVTPAQDLGQEAPVIGSVAGGMSMPHESQESRHPGVPAPAFKVGDQVQHEGQTRSVETVHPSDASSSWHLYILRDLPGYQSHVWEKDLNPAP